MMCRSRAGKPMPGRQGAMHTIILRARSVWTCIFSDLPAWMSFQANQMSCALMMFSMGQHRRGSSIRFTNPTRFSAGCLQKSPRGSAKTLDRS